MDESPQASSVLTTARLQWQFGLWNALAAIDLNSAKVTSGHERSELLRYALEGALQTGRSDVAAQALDALAEVGDDKRELLRSLVSSGFNGLARGWLAVGESGKAEHCIRQSVGVYPERGEENLLTSMRLSQQTRDLGLSAGKNTYYGLDRKDRCLFIDCGGHDGCSVLAFLLAHPNYNCITFEPNPEFWPYYDEVPTELIRKAVYTYDGEVDFIIDPVDGDGSSLFADKRIDAKGQVENDACPRLSVPCVDVSRFVREASETYQTIVLKLDVEGAEYDILERMIEQDTLALVDRVLCEFHGRKMGWDPAREARLIEKIQETHVIEEWDAIAFSIHGATSVRAAQLRRALINSIHANRKGLQFSVEGQR